MYGWAAAVLLAPGAYAAWRVRRAYAGGDRPWLEGAVLAGAAASAAAAGIAGPALIASLALAWTLTVLASIDARIFRLPNRLTYPLVLAGLGWAWLAAPETLRSRLTGTATGYLALAFVALAYRRIRRREGLGLGDAKLLAGAGAWLGWRPLPQVMLVAAVAGLAWALIAGRKTGLTATTRIPFGPMLSLAIWIVWLVAR